MAKAEILGNLLMMPWFGTSETAALTKDVKALHDLITKYIRTLQEQQRRNELRNTMASKASICSTESNFKIKTVEKIAKIDDDYVEVNLATEKLETYECLSLTDYVPDERFKRRWWLENLKLEFPINLYSYFPGGCAQGLHFIWKVPENKTERSDNITLKVIATIQKNVPKYANRAMRRDFIERYENVPQITPKIMRDMFRTLTEDVSAPDSAQQAEVDERVLHFLARSDDEGIILDLRENNGATGKSKFDTFWHETEKYFNEMNTAVQERRHSANSYLPFAISISDLRNQIASRCPEGTPIPSEELIRLQMWPKNPTTKRALQHTGRFTVRFAVQQRQLRAEHEDSKFCQMQFKLIKEFVVQNRSNTLMICLDDKAVVPVGAPGAPISTGVRGHNRSMTSTESNTLLSLDHDFHLCGLIPSVALDVEIPSSTSESFYSGQVYVTVKDKVLEPSSPLRHGQEVVTIVRSAHATDGVNCDENIMVQYTDGGPDHRTTYGSVLIASIIQFIQLDLDFFATARTAPMGSWANPAERVMSLLNLALRNASLGRTKNG